MSDQVSKPMKCVLHKNFFDIISFFPGSATANETLYENLLVLKMEMSEEFRKVFA